jgi:hypothetical protein
MTSHEFVPGELRQADATRREPTRVTPAAPNVTGLHGPGGGPTLPSQRAMVAASLAMEDNRAARHGCYPRRVPGTPRHV